MSNKAMRGVGEGLALVGGLLLKDTLEQRREEGLARLRSEYGVQQARLEDQLAEQRNARQDTRENARTDKEIAARADAAGKQQQFEAGEPSRKAKGEVETTKGLLDLARSEGIEYSALPGVKGGTEGKANSSAKYVDVQEKAVDEFGQPTTVTKSYVEITDPKTRLPRRIPADQYESMLDQVARGKGGQPAAGVPAAARGSPAQGAAQPAAQSTVTPDSNQQMLDEANSRVMGPGYTALLQRRAMVQGQLKQFTVNPQSRQRQQQQQGLQQALDSINQQIVNYQRPG